MEETYKPERRFEAYLIVSKFKGYRNVKMVLFKTDPENNTDTIDFARAIENYDSADEHKVDTEDYLKGLFNWEEVEAMREYFKDWEDMQIFNYSEVCFPIRNNIIGVMGLAVGGLDDFYMFSKAKGYPLKFKVWGYYDLRYCESIEKEYGKDITNWHVGIAPNHPIKGCCTIVNVTNNDIGGASNVVLISPLVDTPDAAKHIRILSTAHQMLRVCELVYVRRHVGSETLKKIIEDAYGEDISKIMLDSPETT